MVLPRQHGVPLLRRFVAVTQQMKRSVNQESFCLVPEWNPILVRLTSGFVQVDVQLTIDPRIGISRKRDHVSRIIMAQKHPVQLPDEPVMSKNNGDRHSSSSFRP